MSNDKIIIDKTINVDEALRDIENFMRNNIVYILRNKYGEKWEEHLGVTSERIDEWKKRMEEEQKRLRGNVIENRLLYYSDFYDLKTIILKNWDLFKNCFSNQTIIKNQLSQLEGFRNPNAHNRDLFEYQKHLLIGYIGEIKNGIMKYRGNLDNKSTFFPECESLNINGIIYNENWAHLDELFRPGDQLTVTIYVTSPNTQKVYYCIQNNDIKKFKWSESNTFQIQIDNHHLGNNTLYVFYKSNSSYHLQSNWDGVATISYTVVDYE